MSKTKKPSDNQAGIWSQAEKLANDPKFKSKAINLPETGHYPECGHDPDYGCACQCGLFYRADELGVDDSAVYKAFHLVKLKA